MNEDTAVIESDDDLLTKQDDTSSDDLREALQSAFNEVNERARDEQGRFAPKDAKTEESVKAPVDQASVDAQQTQAPADQQASPKVEQTTQDGQQQAQQTQPAAVKPPDSWSPAAKAKFSTLDPDIQAEIARREAEVHKGFTRQDEHRNLGKTFEQAVQPYMAMIRSEGSDPVRATAALLQSAYTLRSGSPDQKEQLVLGLMSQFQIDPNRVFQRLAGGQSQQQQSDPQVVQLRQTVEQLQQRLMQGDQQVQQQEQAQINTTIESFASDPKNLYFANVKPEMAALLRDGRAKDLQEAYDMACWARPDIRSLLLQQQDQQRQATERGAAADRAAKARRAGSVLTGSPSGQPASPQAASGSLEDDIRAAIRQVNGGGV